MITAEGVKLLDFGLAAFMVSDSLDTPDRPAVTRIPGTVQYMAPEQIRGEDVDGRADVFSLGLVLHEMLSGRRAFERPTIPETLQAILNDGAPPLPDTVPAAQRGSCQGLRRFRRNGHSAARTRRPFPSCASRRIATCTESPSRTDERRAAGVPSVGRSPFHELAHRGLGLQMNESGEPPPAQAKVRVLQRAVTNSRRLKNAATGCALDSCRHCSVCPKFACWCSAKSAVFEET